MTGAVRAAAADAGAPGLLASVGLRHGAAGIVVADRPGADGGPAHRITWGAHGPVSGRRVAAGGHQPRAGGRGGRRVRHRGRRGRRGAGVGPRRSASRTTRSANRPTSSSPGHPTSWPRSSGRPASCCRRCCSTRSSRTPWARPSTSVRDQQRDQIAALWARFNAVAAHNPEAAFPEPRSAAEIATPGAGQPPARLSLQPLARQPVDGRPVLRAGDLLGRAGTGGGRPARALALPPRRAALLGGGDADRAAPAAARGPP